MTTSRSYHLPKKPLRESPTFVPRAVLTLKYESPNCQTVGESLQNGRMTEMKRKREPGGNRDIVDSKTKNLQEL